MSMASEYNTRVSDCFRHAGNNVALSGIVLPVGTPPLIHPGSVFGNRGTRLTCRLSRLQRGQGLPAPKEQASARLLSPFNGRSACRPLWIGNPIRASMANLVARLTILWVRTGASS
jgi:hypothetical protein